MTKNNNGKKLPKHLTKGGPGDKFKGGGKVDTSTWFHNPLVGNTELEKQIKNEEIYFCNAPFQVLYTDVQGDYGPCSWADTHQFGPKPFTTKNIRDISIQPHAVKAKK